MRWTPANGLVVRAHLGDQLVRGRTPAPHAREIGRHLVERVRRPVVQVIEPVDDAVGKISEKPPVVTETAPKPQHNEPNRAFFNLWFDMMFGRKR